MVRVGVGGTGTEQACFDFSISGPNANLTGVLTGFISGD